jgi:hypothetical protein
VEFERFGQWDEPVLFLEFRYVLGWPEGAKHLVCGLMKVFREGLQVLIRKARHAWGRVFFVGLNGGEVVVIGGRLGEDLMKL